MKQGIITTFILAIALFFNSCGGNEKKTESTPEKQAINIEKKDEVKAEENPALAAGEKLFNDKGCTACHQVSAKVIGPGLQTIANAYAENPSEIVSFLKEESEAIVEPALYPTMQVNLNLTKEMNEEELNALKEFIMSYQTK